ncbi:DUF5999 family protein [Streptomyces qinzhouensis]|uniref:Uncharacterized protein n=1 Tax=Streptomyces qinzhouensis TaxID=2599401 RepID=A0A5B8J5V6_9ACTN|nr:DUF5999 family protein [Streptomyces qinzhouensis]QDY75421.1 hypothetical protein FQU76_01645 [Streptomyces qinzhouensis]
MCAHLKPCPAADAADRSAAVTLSRDCVTGWALLCNGVPAWISQVRGAPTRTSFAATDTVTVAMASDGYVEVRT